MNAGISAIRSLFGYSRTVQNSLNPHCSQIEATPEIGISDGAIGLDLMEEPRPPLIHKLHRTPSTGKDVRIKNSLTKLDVTITGTTHLVSKSGLNAIGLADELEELKDGMEELKDGRKLTIDFNRGLKAKRGPNQ